VDFEIPADLAGYLDELDAFIEREIRPLEGYMFGYMRQRAPKGVSES
jgi:hypothetical protein